MKLLDLAAVAFNVCLFSLVPPVSARGATRVKLTQLTKVVQRPVSETIIPWHPNLSSFPQFTHSFTTTVNTMLMQQTLECFLIPCQCMFALSVLESCAWWCWVVPL